MNVTVLRCPPATYSIAQSESKSSEGFTHVLFLKQPNQSFVFILNSFKLTFLLPLTLESGTRTEIQMMRLSQQNCSTNKHMIAATVQHSHEISFKTCKYKNVNLVFHFFKHIFQKVTIADIYFHGDILRL